ncbi:MAG: type I glyceraldehyde-3-phosphate dehydrogenase [Desulfobulbaceae bacterium]|uniref:Glyceraldehyde-3-phosphate dehydrogenase n=1 Tax=Candidatus Desulfobia pelagia TaxID=2841692 RepID=A0A8J6NET7_9BACT|nr:type I glyceraldehyde-3-phosphate dehydrogenase [Candidatus Desulfobia pelagia]
MTIKVGINGFGRIGRSIFRALSKDAAFADIEVQAINDLTNNETLAHLLKYDSVMGIYEKTVSADEQGIIVDGRHITIFNHRNPADIPWADMGVDYVIESTGLFTDSEKARAHIEAGAKKVIISAPAKGKVKTIVMGVNEHEYDPSQDHIVSNASCTTNCLAPFAKIILDRFGLVKGLMTTVHAYTNDQRILDFPHSDLRRARAAAVSMIPTKTGAAAAVALVIPELKGKFDGLAVRVPTPNVSLVDAVIEVEQETTISEVNQALKDGTNRFLGFSDEPLVSIDYQGNPYSSVIDGMSTKVIGGTMVKILSWYDNEWGYSNRVLDLILLMESQKPL